MEELGLEGSAAVLVRRGQQSWPCWIHTPPGQRPNQAVLLPTHPKGPGGQVPMRFFFPSMYNCTICGRFTFLTSRHYESLELVKVFVISKGEWKRRRSQRKGENPLSETECSIGIGGMLKFHMLKSVSP